MEDLLKVLQYDFYHGVVRYLEIDLPRRTASIRNAFPHSITIYNQT